jgi:hypothetical protein
MSPEFASQLKKVLGSIVLLYNRLSPSDLEQLLSLTLPLRTTIEPLQSVVIYPQNDHDDIYLIHPTFYDFLVNPGQCSDNKFLIRPEMQHSLLALACLDTMKVLERNICQVKQPWKVHTELDNLPKLVDQFIPPFLQYACRHWVQHMTSGLL